MVQGLKFLSKKSFHPQNRSNQKRVWEREQEKQHEQTRIREREAQLRREREDEELAKLRGDNKIQFLYKPPPGLEINPENDEKHSLNTQLEKPKGDSLFERQPGDDDAAAAFRRLLAGHATESNTTEIDATKPVNKTAATTNTSFGTVLQGSNADRSDAPKPELTALEKSVGRKKHQNLTFDEQVQRFPALANAPRAKGVSSTDVGVTFQPLGTQIRNVRCLACGTWGHSRGDRECAKTGWNPFATTSALDSAVATHKNILEQQPSSYPEQRRKRDYGKDDDFSSSNECDDDSDSRNSTEKDRKRRYKRHRKSRDRSPSRKKRKEKTKSKKSRKH